MSSPVFLTDSAADIASAARTLVDGGLLGIPTETVYGLAADALNPQAVAAIFKAKGRPSDHPLIVHVFSVAQVSLYAAEVPAFAQALMKAFWRCLPAATRRLACALFLPASGRCGSPPNAPNSTQDATNG